MNIHSIPSYYTAFLVYSCLIRSENASSIHGQIYENLAEQHTIFFRANGCLLSNATYLIWFKWCNTWYLIQNNAWLLCNPSKTEICFHAEHCCVNNKISLKWNDSVLFLWFTMISWCHHKEFLYNNWVSIPVSKKSEKILQKHGELSKKSATQLITCLGTTISSSKCELPMGITCFQRTLEFPNQ